MTAPDDRLIAPPEERPDPSLSDAREYDPRLGRRKTLGVVFAGLCIAATLVGVVALVILLWDIVHDGAPAVSADFVASYPSRFPERAGILPALVGSLWVLVLTAAVAFPLGVGTAIWLEEYAPNNRLRRTIQTNIANLAGVPSIVYGILGLAVFVRAMAMGRSILAGAMTLALLILPVIIIASQEAIRAVPSSIRLGAYALGATRWQVVSRQVLPMALPGILTGTILALSRAVGETAPLIVVGAAAFVGFVPTSVTDAFTVMPIQIFNWIARPQPGFHERAAGGILVLLIVLLSLNAAAILLRNRYSRKW
ncbi:MAG: phosphate ABC transporter permease PstA [Gemmatimonadetes bacterium]|uniref:Phosphate transport system permease protein PstA n=1 Tax=Candidatus Kutchimonas denitrificans TaxID=3056748 RepID=A0AAE4ZBR4_9BACT|nr:phosphate ABC transporter permease PstA [Gemmatimonadota bacterium]NIR76402.1 phosphate ABC transporter permease PstA [Candidatus Kutchimonas denitrificans]NIU73969.1 phosphate ABC transporter permease PstA [Gammaproteobacteria bacterium]NIS00576.1 phosphate ABC transporter permease PstA [Gemmatimonadota bacterium]NIW38318.1 phosphate ABC transporter permease PstA [Gemmatimonadota bacterium]